MAETLAIDELNCQQTTNQNCHKVDIIIGIGLKAAPFIFRDKFSLTFKHCGVHFCFLTSLLKTKR